MRMFVFIAALVVGFGTTVSRAAEISVSAAISLKDALNDVAAKYQQRTGDKVTFQFGSSGQLAAQIRQGAPADLFISAARRQVDELGQDVVDLSSLRVVAGNSLVLVVPPGAKQPPTSVEELTDPRFKRISIGDPKTVPAGDYSIQVLDALNIAQALKPRLIFGANVRQVLNYVERGEVDAGIAYKTDAIEAGGKVKVVATADAKLHKPIEYPAVLVKASRHEDAARRFLEFLCGDDATAIFAARGFAVPSPTTPTTRPAHE